MDNRRHPLDSYNFGALHTAIRRGQQVCNVRNADRQYIVLNAQARQLPANY